jgi:hypothetical protein
MIMPHVFTVPHVHPAHLTLSLPAEPAEMFASASPRGLGIDKPQIRLVVPGWTMARYSPTAGGDPVVSLGLSVSSAASSRVGPVFVAMAAALRELIERRRAEAA